MLRFSLTWKIVLFIYIINTWIITISWRTKFKALVHLNNP